MCLYVVANNQRDFSQRETPVKRSRNAVKNPTKRGKGGGAEKRPIVALVERAGEACVEHMTTVTSANIRAFMDRCVDFRARLHTDESVLYPSIGTAFASHETVNHGAREYARGDVTTNTAEGFFGLFKRGFNGIYQHCSKAHFQRYLDEYTFRYNNRIKLGVDDDDRAERATKAMNGKRLTYRRIAARKKALLRRPTEPAQKSPGAPPLACTRLMASRRTATAGS
jgi:ISXO2-like transposase domain